MNSKLPWISMLISGSAQTNFNLNALYTKYHYIKVMGCNIYKNNCDPFNLVIHNCTLVILVNYTFFCEVGIFRPKY